MANHSYVENKLNKELFLIKIDMKNILKQRFPNEQFKLVENNDKDKSFNFLHVASNCYVSLQWLNKENQIEFRHQNELDDWIQYIIQNDLALMYGVNIYDDGLGDEEFITPRIDKYKTYREVVELPFIKPIGFFKRHTISRFVKEAVKQYGNICSDG